MIYILTRAAVADIARFTEVFGARGLEMRQKHGCLHSQLFKILDQDNQVTALFEWESRAAFEGFLADPMVRETMQSGGTLAPPTFIFLEKLGEFLH